MVILEHGDIFKSDANIICHQVNLHGIMRSGIAKTIREKFPNVYEEYRLYTPKAKLGDILIVNTNKSLLIANLYGQRRCSLTRNVTSYKYITKCLNKAKEYAKYNNLKIAVPYGMSCVGAGGNWDKMLRILNQVFSDYDVYIYKL